ncbi:hypothetical protein R2F25_37395 [Streptomyces sp. UP1A-1]|nr:hypothetical protein [Streptomyces sp. UP1A-1]
MPARGDHPGTAHAQTSLPAGADRGVCRLAAEPDGRCFDPWLRTHLELGARQLGIAHRSLVIRQPVSRWEEFLGLTLPGPGDHPLPGGLVPLRVGDDGHGTYAEPNVWVHHPAGAP